MPDRSVKSDFTINDLKRLSRDEFLELEAAIKLNEAKKARSNLLSFTTYIDPGFEVSQFHKSYYEILDLFAKNVINNLIITCPPQHGKSTGSTINLPAYLFGLDPDLRIAISSYSTPITQRFNRFIQRIITTEKYHHIFPETNLGNSNIVTIASSPLRNASEFEIIDKNGNIRGKLMSIGRGGSLTSQTVDVWVGDDLYKDAAEGNSPVIREQVWDWYVSVPLSRQPRKKIIVYTRWHEDDVIGRIEQKEKVVTVESFNEIHNAIELYGKDVWIKVNFQAIKDGEATEIDPRVKNTALWQSKRSLDKLLKIRNLDAESFNCLYQGDPVSREGLLYNEFRTWKQLPDPIKIGNVTDTKETGKDYMCSINYVKGTDGEIYITDVEYTQDGPEITEYLIADMLINGGIKEAEIESNSGGRAFGRNVDKILKNRGYNCIMIPYHQSRNKESRILTNAAHVNRIIMPFNWDSRFPDFYMAVTRFKKLFQANKNDDAPDVLTRIVEKNQYKAFSYQIK